MGKFWNEEVKVKAWVVLANNIVWTLLGIVVGWALFQG